MQEPVFIGSPIYRGSSYGARHPLAIPRVPVVTDLARALGWLPAARYRTSPRAKPEALERFHSRAYIAALRRAEESQSVDAGTRARHGLGTLSNPVFAEMFRRPATAAGGGLLAAELVREGGAVFNPGGGTHHGMPDRAAGFCYLNEPALTILRLREMGFDRIVYVDIDAHHGDGVQAAFHGSDRVRVISVHEARRWPFTGALADTGGGAAFNLPVPRGFNDSEFHHVLEEMILPATEAFAPQVIYLQCGADALLEDPLSRLALSNRVYATAVRALRALAPRLIVSGGGGYNPWSVGRAWCVAWGALLGEDLPEGPLPEAAQAVLAALDWPRRARPAPRLLGHLLDAPRPGPLRAELREAVSRLRARIRDRTS